MRNVKARIALLALGSLVLLNACNAQEDKKTGNAETVVVVVNGTPLYQSMVDNFMKQAAMQNAPDTPEVRKAVLEELVGREVARQDAVKQGYNKRPEVKQQVEFAEMAIVVNAYLQDFSKTHPASDDLLKAEYDKIKTQMGDKQYQARHILVKTEKEALDILAQLKKGTKFDKLASSKSLDQGSKSKGGDLGFNPPARFVKPFADAMVALKKGETVKAPVQTQFGYHIIKLEDVKDMPAFDEVKANLAPRVQQEQLRKHIEDLRAKAKIEYKGAQAPAATTIPVPSTPTDKPAQPAPAEKK
jgi:peptidyl-prolyl cis-trans isomerase C